MRRRERVIEIDPSDVQHHFVDAGDTEGGEERRPDDLAEAPQLRVGHLVQHGSHEIEVGQTHFSFSSSLFLPNPIPKANMKSIVILFISRGGTFASQQMMPFYCMLLVEAEQTFHPAVTVDRL